MTRRKPDPRQLGFDFNAPAFITPASALMRQVFKPEALPSFPLHVPCGAEEAEAIAAVPFGQRWLNFAAVGAVPERIEVPLKRQNRVTLQVTETRLGWTSGYNVWLRRPVGPDARNGCGSLGGGGGGHLHADSDEHGFYLWTSRAAAIRSAAHQAWWACWELDAKLAAEVERALEAAVGASPVQVPGDDAKRWLVSRADGDASLERRRAQRGADVPESPAIDEYRRACGLTDTTAWRDAA